MENELINRRRFMPLLGLSSLLTQATRVEIIDSFGYSAYISVMQLLENNPSLAPYINEDPHIICSFVDCGIMRCLKGDGISYLDTQFSFSQETSYEIEFKSILKQMAARQLEGEDGNNRWWGIEANTLQFGKTGAKVSFEDNSVNIIKYTRPSTERKLYITLNDNAAGNVDTIAQNYFAYMTHGVTNLGMQDQRLYIKITYNGVLVREMYPFIRNNTNGMVDILSNTFYANGGSGTFAIDEVIL